MPKQPACGNAPALSDLQMKTVHLHGLMAVLADFKPHDTRTRNGMAALLFTAEELAGEISRDMETLSDDAA